MTAQTLPRTEPDTPTDAPGKRLFTREEYHAMGKAGILGHQERVELLEGEIIVMAPPGIWHVSRVDRLTHIFMPLGTQRRAIVRVQSPSVITQTSEFQPDITLLTFRDDFYGSRKPRPQDILLLVEVADSSLDYDRNVKLRHYAEVGIPETWIVNLQDDHIEAHTEPTPQGYRATRIYRLGDTISPTAFPDIQINVNDIIPPRPNSDNDTQNGDDNDNSEQ